MSEILMTFSPDGEVVIEVIGCEGSECLEKTSSLEAALGRPKTRTLKAEFTEKKPNEKRIALGE